MLKFPRAFMSHALPTMLVTSELFDGKPHMINVSDFDPSFHTVADVAAVTDKAQGEAVKAMRKGKEVDPSATLSVDPSDGGSQGTRDDGSEVIVEDGTGTGVGTPGSAPGTAAVQPKAVKIGSNYFVVDGVTGAKLIPTGFKKEADAIASINTLGIDPNAAPGTTGPNGGQTA